MFALFCVCVYNTYMLNNLLNLNTMQNFVLTILTAIVTMLQDVTIDPADDFYTCINNISKQ